MDIRLRGSLLALAALLVGTGAPAQALPDGVTPRMVAEGRRLFEGRGLCAGCHGARATGAVGPDLTDAEWWHSDGSYEAIARQILAGVPPGTARSGVPMPPRGGSSLSEAEVRAVAAYVHSLRGVERAAADAARACPNGGTGAMGAHRGMGGPHRHATRERNGPCRI